MTSLRALVISPSSLAVLAALAAIGCSSTPESQEPDRGSETSDSDLRRRRSSACAGKACGGDCTPHGSNAAFNCTAAGACVPTGRPLGCACPEFVGDCTAGDVPSFDARGCRSGCKPALACPEFLGDCTAGDVPSFDARGCRNGCKHALACPEFVGDCTAGDVPSFDARGCRNGCKHAPK